MQDNISIIIATIILVILIVIFPIYNVANRHDSVASNLVVKTTTTFVDSIRNKGYIDKDSYDRYASQITSTGNTYDIEIEVHRKVIVESSTGIYEDEYEIENTKAVLKQLEEVPSITNTKEDVLSLITSGESVVTRNACILNEGDKVYIRVKNTNTTQAQVLFHNIFGGDVEPRVVVNYGGTVYSSEWAKGDSATAISAGIKLSRPFNGNGQEYKYEQVYNFENPFTGLTESVFTIAARLTGISPNDVIKFRVTCSKVLKQNGDNIAGKIKNGIVKEGFNADISVTTESEEMVGEGMCNGTYVITFSRIILDPGVIYSDSSVSIKAGTLQNVYGPTPTITSKDFTIIYEEKELEMEYTKKQYNSNGTLIEGAGTVNYVIILPSLNKDNSKIETIKWAKGEHDRSYFKNGGGTEIKQTYNAANKNYNFRVDENDKYTVYAKDNSGKEVVKIIEIIGVGSDRLKFVLNWEKTFDFDMHLKGTKNGSEIFHVKHNNKTYSGFGKVTLNQDNLSGGMRESDAEIIVLDEAAVNMVYTCFIHAYSSGDNSFYKKKPRLIIYRGDAGKEVEIYDSNKDKTWTENGGYRYWYILSYDANKREIKFIDEYRNNE